MATQAEPTRPRRRRGIAFFEPIIDESEASSSSSSSHSEEKPTHKPQSTTTTSTDSKSLLLFTALPLLILLTYLLTLGFVPAAPATPAYQTTTVSSSLAPLLTDPSSPPATSPSSSPTAAAAALSPYKTTTPLTPFLSSLGELTSLSPALPYTGLAGFILLRDLGAITSVPAPLLAQAQEMQTLVEEFSGEDFGFHEAVMEGLEQFLSVENASEEGLKEGYKDFFAAREVDTEGLKKRTEDLEPVFGKVLGGLGDWQLVVRKEGGKDGDIERLWRIVEWIALVFGKADDGLKKILEEARKGKKEVEGLGKGWMGEELLKREVKKIEKYKEAESKASAVEIEIGNQHLNGENPRAVEEKLEKAIMEGEVNWW